MDYFILGPGTKAKREVSAKTTSKMHKGYSDVFAQIECFKGTFTLQVKDDVNLYQVSLRHIVYATQELLKRTRLHKQQILVPLEVDEMAKWCNSFILVPNVMAQ